MTLSDQDKASLETRGYQITDRSGDGFTIVTRGNLEEANFIGTAHVEVKALDDEGFERSGGVSLSAEDKAGRTPEIVISVGGWRGHAESTVGLRAQAACLAYAADLIEAWREREDRLARIAAVFPAAAAEARQAGKS